ncbi:hypothetical protein ACFSQ3_09345 [Sphingobacterium corticis]|uniref:ABC transporter permease n=1 Tax=Sphingobacterium corticis TaxID=1812823 RepID=A0ABW5NKJ4_9SPHI
MKNINIQRLKIAITEYGLINKNKLISIPVVVLGLYLLTMFWYGTPLFNQLFHLYPYPNLFLESLSRYNGTDVATLALFTLPLYIIMCTTSYLKRTTKSVFGTMSPITRGERIITLWIGNLAIIVLILLSFFFANWSFVSVMKSIYLADAIAYKESVGELYYNFSDKSYFVTFGAQIYKVSILLSLVFACLYQLSATFFRKYSIPLFILMIIGFGFLFFQLLTSLYKETIYIYNGSDFNSMAFGIVFTLLFIGFVVTTYFKLREKEVH